MIIKNLRENDVQLKSWMKLRVWTYNQRKARPTLSTWSKSQSEGLIPATQIGCLGVKDWISLSDSWPPSATKFVLWHFARPGNVSWRFVHLSSDLPWPLVYASSPIVFLVAMMADKGPKDEDDSAIESFIWREDSSPWDTNTCSKLPVLCGKRPVVLEPTNRASVGLCPRGGGR